LWIALENTLSQRTELAAPQSAAANNLGPLGVREPVSQSKGNGYRPLAAVGRVLRESDLFAPLLRRSFRILQRAGINVTPCHYYWPIPDMAELEKRPWPECAFSIPFDLRLDRQLDFLKMAVETYGHEWSFGDRPIDTADYHYNNGFFESVDAEIAYSVVRQYKPARIIEIGTGFSTRVLAAALQSNLLTAGFRGELISIDPYLDRVPKLGFSGAVTIIPQRVQDVDLDLFGSLGKNDILFIDSSHIAGVGSDVVREYLEILPRLRSGVLVHVHDIFLPSDYPRQSVLNDLWFWSEQYLLQAFLTFNSNFKVLWSSSAMQTFHRQDLETAFPRWPSSYLNMPKKTRRFVPTPDNKRVWPSSFWMVRL
jgi:predicted O-methyltransferase YrrM